MTPCGAAASGRKSNLSSGGKFGVDHRARRRGCARPPSPAGGDRSAAPARCPRTARGPGSRRPSAWATQPATARIMRPPCRARGFFQPAQPAEFGKHLFGRLLADMAGVEDHHVGVVGRRRRAIAERRQHVRHAGAVIHVHLAAPGDDVQTLELGSCEDTSRWRGRSDPARRRGDRPGHPGGQAFVTPEQTPSFTRGDYATARRASPA